ncbi:glycosyltransferase domain-containing protein [Chamaesiphon polymorphus]|uniref:PLOD1-3-like GT domain-containing protein n=1 Tax=Chamaesiphon polymorphus CCALA 037 TaxID=2107692 RepID=A0A2T1GMU5_9CYAN|nr:glycosyltransferase domain-containing protein [Chamaesiphon polymorphus]PSB59238.1 hypothetical protein C7B77_01685 [Chamaesiphon polymorphus CCALA 037]
MEYFRVRNKLFNTYPSIFHHPGKIGDGNRIIGIVQLKKMFFDLIGDSNNGYFLDYKEKIRLKIPIFNSNKVNEIANKLTVIFVSNLKEIGSGPRSFDFFGIPYRMLGSQVNEWSSNGLKLEFLHNELPSIKTKYFMLLDSNDTFTINNLIQTIEIFETSFDCEVLLNAGQNLWPHWNDEMREYKLFCDLIGEKNNSDHKYINTGAFIAKTEFYREMIKTFDINKSPLPGDDQAAFYPLYKQYYPRIQLDYTCKIFQCEFDEELEVESSTMSWYQSNILNSKSLVYPLLKKHAVWRRSKKDVS